jgi:hypothetical protein
VVKSPWIINEDAALTAKLLGIRVTDENAKPAGREVPVLWQGPEFDVQNVTYPMIGIESLGWFRAPEREHRNYIRLPYAPEGYPPWWNVAVPVEDQQPDPTESPYYTWFPIPYNFDYQVTVMARLERDHLIPIVTKLAQIDYLHPHFAFLNVPQDGTVRTMLLNGGPEKEYRLDDDNKRIVTATYNIRVCSELLGPIDTTANYGGSMALATTFDLSLDVYSGPITEESLPELTSSFGVLSVGRSSGWNTQ